MPPYLTSVFCLGAGYCVIMPSIFTSLAKLDFAALHTGPVLGKVARVPKIRSTEWLTDQATRDAIYEPRGRADWGGREPIETVYLIEMAFARYPSTLRFRSFRFQRKVVARALLR